MKLVVAIIAFCLGALLAVPLSWLVASMAALPANCVGTCDAAPFTGVIALFLLAPAVGLAFAIVAARLFGRSRPGGANFEPPAYASRRPEVIQWQERLEKSVRDFWKDHAVPSGARAEFLAEEMKKAVAAKDNDRAYLIGEVALETNGVAQLPALHALLLVPGHERHQEIVRALQLLRRPESVPWLSRALDENLEAMSDSSCSEHGVIAQWFSHAFFDIGTPEAIEAIHEFASTHPDEAVRAEMKRRLSKLSRPA